MNEDLWVEALREQWRRESKGTSEVQVLVPWSRISHSDFLLGWASGTLNMIGLVLRSGAGNEKWNQGVITDSDRFRRAVESLNRSIAE